MMSVTYRLTSLSPKPIATSLYIPTMTLTQATAAYISIKNVHLYMTIIAHIELKSISESR